MNRNHLAQVAVIFYGPGDSAWDDDHEIWRKPFDETTVERTGKTLIGQDLEPWYEFSEPNAGMEIAFAGEWNNGPSDNLLANEVKEIGIKEVIGEDLLEELFEIAEKRIASEQERIDKLPLASSKHTIHAHSFIVAFKAQTWSNAPDDFGVMAEYMGVVNMSRLSEILIKDEGAATGV